MDTDAGTLSCNDAKAVQAKVIDRKLAVEYGDGWEDFLRAGETDAQAKNIQFCQDKLKKAGGSKGGGKGKKKQ